MNSFIIKLRKIEKADMFDIIEMLQQLSEYKPSEKTTLIFGINFHPENIYSLVATIEDKIVDGSLLIETKIRGGKMGHIEDIVSHLNYKNKDVGKTIVNGLFDIAKREGCYKVSLQCKNNNITFMKSVNLT